MQQETPTFKQFILRYLIWNFVITAVFLSVFWWCNMHYVGLTANRTVFLTNLIALPLVSTHTVLILIFSIRRFVRKHTVFGLIYFAHFLLSSVIAYYLWVAFALFGWAYAMKA
ncbi:MAG: hypothetical protein Fur0041_17350 [Bacteroidia bacterium]